MYGRVKDTKTKNKIGGGSLNKAPMKEYKYSQWNVVYPLNEQKISC